MQRLWLYITSLFLCLALASPLNAHESVVVRILNPIPKGEKIIYLHRLYGFPATIYSMKPDGSARTPILEGNILEMRPSPDGKKILVSTGDPEEHYSTEGHYWGPVHMHLWLMDEKGIRQITSGNVRDGAASWSFDGKKVYFARASNVEVLNNNELHTGAPNIWELEMESGKMRQLTTSEDYANFHSRPSPDGKKIAFVSLRNPMPQIYIMNSDGTGEQPFIEDAMFGNWSPDGTRFAFLRGQPGDIFIAKADGKDIKQVTKTSRVVSEPSWSPDGKKIVYAEINPETGSEILSDSPIGDEHEHNTPIEDIWIKEVDRDKPPIRLTKEGDSNSLSYWTE